MPRSRLSFSPPPVYNHEGQNDVVQHIHSCRSNIKSRFLLLGNVAWAVEFGNNGIVVNSHQLLRLFDGSFEFMRISQCRWISDSPHLWNVHSHRTQCPPVVNAVRSSKCEAPGGQDQNQYTILLLPRCKFRRESAHPFNFPHLGKNSSRLVIFPRKIILFDENHFQ